MDCKNYVNRQDFLGVGLILQRAHIKRSASGLIYIVINPPRTHTHTCKWVQIDRLQKSHSVPVPFPTMNHLVTEMVYCGIWSWCIMGFVQQVCLNLLHLIIHHNCHALAVFHHRYVCELIGKQSNDKSEQAISLYPVLLLSCAHCIKR